MANIVIDLTPLLPGGENGGAKSMVLELVQQLGKINPTDHFLLLTAEKTHKELLTLETDNIRCFCALLTPKINSSRKINPYFLGSRFLRRALNFLKRRLFPLGRKQICIRKKLFKNTKPDLVFFPFTAPFFEFPKVPIVSVIYDLQFLEYPYFFAPETQIERMGHFKLACEKAARLVCISEFTRQSVLKHAPFAIEAKNTTVVPIHIASEWIQKGAYGGMPELLKEYTLEHGQFLFYPANFWAHKNHKMLLTAFALYRKKNPTSSLKLVCTGAPETGRDAIQQAAKLIGLSEHVIFPGYVSSHHLFVLMSACKALIFPSLYEGFGMPVVEAMLLGKPVICSQHAALKEIGEENFLYFHPGKPKEILQHIEKVEYEFDSLRPNILKGYQKALQYSDTKKMAEAYMNVFKEVMQKRQFLEEV